MLDFGVKLQLWLGATIPRPVSFDVIDALLETEVTNTDREGDAFQLKFALGKESLLDYDLLRTGQFDPPARVIVVVLAGPLPKVLIDGVITSHQVMPSNKPGDSTLLVTGEDISLLLDLEEKDETFPNQPDSVIVTRLLTNYPQLGLIPAVAPTKEVPFETERITTQQDTDLGHILTLAERNGFVFRIAPTAPLANTAYWGAEKRSGQLQPALTMNMGPHTNVDTPINFHANALGPAAPKVSFVEPLTGQRIELPIPSLTQLPLATKPAPSLRKPRERRAGHLSPVQAGLRAVSGGSEAADALVATGELDVIRYGQPLEVSRLVGLRGVGAGHNGIWYVKKVTHRLKRGEYKQSFTLTREGRGSLVPVVRP